MAIEKSGIQLVAEGYDDYMNKLRAINAQQQQTFSGGTTAMAGAQRQTQATTQAMGGLTSALGTVKGAMGAVTAVFGAFMAIGVVRKVMDFANASVQVAMRNETLGVSLQVVGKQAGYSAAQIAYAEAAVKKMGITTQAARQSLIRMAQANVEFADAAGLARIAQDAAVIGNMNSSEALERMIYGIQSGQVEVLKTIGINVTFEQSYRKLAEQLHKNRLDLNETEKAQARANAVMEAGKRIAGTYEAAMTTAGKQQNSLARYIENTQENLGNLLLPFAQVKVAMETTTWKGFEDATRGLRGLSEILKVVADQLTQNNKATTDWAGNLVLSVANAVVSLTGLNLVLKGVGVHTYETLAAGETFGMRMGRGIQDLTRAATQFAAMWGAAMTAASEAIGEFLNRQINVLKALVTGGLDAAIAVAMNMTGETTTFMDRFHQHFTTIYADMLAKFPETFKDYSELGDIGETSLTRVKTASDLAVEALDKQAKSLNAVLDAMKQVEKIQNTYNKGVQKATDTRDKDLAKQAAQTLKDREKATENYNRAMTKLDTDYASQLAMLREKAATDYKRSQAELYRTLKRMDQQYQLDKIQSQRQFTLNERWLMAEGDVLGLMQAREQHAIDVQTAKENYEQQRRIAKEDGELTLKEKREDLQAQIDELGKNIQERREELTKAYRDELEQIRRSNDDRNAEINANYRQQLDDLRESRDEQIRALGESLADEGIVTQEGMNRLQAILNSLFGENQAGDALMQGWTERGQSAIHAWADALSAELARIEAQMEAIQARGVVAIPNTPYGGPTSPLYPAPPGYQMRSGGSGVVTGPATFQIEPGHKEFFMFAPMAKFGRNLNINANVSGGIDIRGAQGASPGVVDAAVNTTMSELREAIRRMSKS